MNVEKERTKLLRTKEDVFAQQTEIEAKLTTLRSQLPSLLLSNAMGENGHEEVAKLKAEIARLEDHLQDVPLIYEEIQRRLDDIKIQENQALREVQREKARQCYQELTSNLLEQPYDRWLDGKIRQLGHELGLTSETNKLINGWKHNLSRTIASEL